MENEYLLLHKYITTNPTRVTHYKDTVSRFFACSAQPGQPRNEEKVGEIDYSLVSQQNNTLNSAAASNHTTFKGFESQLSDCVLNLICTLNSKYHNSKMSILETNIAQVVVSRLHESGLVVLDDEDITQAIQHAKNPPIILSESTNHCSRYVCAFI